MSEHSFVQGEHRHGRHGFAERLVHGFVRAMAQALDARGVYVAGFFFPVVPRGQARIRTQMNAAIAMEDLDIALQAFREAGKETGVI